MGDTRVTGRIVPESSRSISKKDINQDGLRKAEDELLYNSLNVVGGVCDFAALDPADLDQIPKEWKGKFDKTELKKRHRLAKAGWMDRKNAPFAIDVATKVLAAIVRARATEKSAPSSLNVTMVSMVDPRHKSTEVLDVMDVDDDYDK